MLDDATASFAASPARCNSSTRAAFIIAGHARTFILKDVRHSLLVNAIRAFEARAFTFFLISGDDHGSNKGHRPVVSDETAVREAASEFRPTVFRYDSGERELPQLPATCVLNGTKSGDYWRSGQSWWVQAELVRPDVDPDQSGVQPGPAPSPAWLSPARPGPAWVA